MQASVRAEVLSGCMALVTLGFRNGTSLCGTLGTIELAAQLSCEWMRNAAVNREDVSTAAAAMALQSLCWNYAPTKPSSEREEMDKTCGKLFKKIMDTAAKGFTDQRASDVNREAMSSGLLSHDDLSFACGACFMLTPLDYAHPGALPTAVEAGVFGAILALYNRVEPLQLDDGFWISACDARA